MLQSKQSEHCVHERVATESQRSLPWVVLHILGLLQSRHNFFLAHVGTKMSLHARSILLRGRALSKALPNGDSVDLASFSAEQASTSRQVVDGAVGSSGTGGPKQRSYCSREFREADLRRAPLC